MASEKAVATSLCEKVSSMQGIRLYRECQACGVRCLTLCCLRLPCSLLLSWARARPLLRRRPVVFIHKDAALKALRVRCGSLKELEFLFWRMVCLRSTSIGPPELNVPSQCLRNPQTSLRTRFSAYPRRLNQTKPGMH